MADVRLTFDADTRTAERAVSGLADEADDLTEALDDVTSAGRDTDDALRDVQDAADDAADSARDLADDLEKIEDAVPADVGRKLGDDLEDGFKRAGDGASEFKDEAAGSAREGAASFQGEFSDVQDYLQEVAANAFSGFGPAGAAAGLAAAAGIGILGQYLETIRERAEAAQERTRDLADELVDVSGELERIDWRGFWSEYLSGMESTYGAPWAQQTIDGWDAIQTIARDTGRTVEEVFTAFRDPRSAEALDLQAEAAERLGTGLGRTYGAADETTAAWQLLRDTLGDSTDVVGAATDRADAMTDALGSLQAATEFVREGTETYNESVQDALAEAGDSWEKYTEDGKVDLAGYAQAMEDQIAAVEAYQENMTTVSQQLSDEALAYLQNMGVEAAPLLEAFVNAPAAEQERIAAIWDQLGGAAVTGFSDGAAGLTGAATDAANTASENAPPVTFGTAVDDSDLQRQVNLATDRVRPPTVGVRLRIGMEVV